MEKKQTSSDEIDLQELLLKTVLLIRRNFVLITSFFIAGALLGYAYTILGTKVYESKMLLFSDLLTETYVSEVGETMNDVLADKNFALLATRLSLTEEEAGKIESIDISGVLKEKPIENTVYNVETRRLFYLSIVVEVDDTSILPKLQNGLIKYLESNEYVKKRVENKTKYIVEVLKKVDDEIVQLDEFKRKIYNGTAETKGTLILDLSQINGMMIGLYEKKYRIQNELSVVNSLQVVEGFTAYNKPAKPNKLLSLVAGASLGLIFVALLIAFKSIRALVRLAEKSNS